MEKRSLRFTVLIAYGAAACRLADEPSWPTEKQRCAPASPETSGAWPGCSWPPCCSR